VADQDMSKLNATSTTSAIDGAGSTSAMFDGDSGDTVSKGDTDGACSTAVGDKRRRHSNECEIIDLSGSDSDHTHARLRSMRGRCSSAPSAPRGTRRGRGRGRGRSAVSELSIPDDSDAILTSVALIARPGATDVQAYQSARHLLRVVHVEVADEDEDEVQYQSSAYLMLPY
jgi:hypothetical protein